MRWIDMRGIFDRNFDGWKPHFLNCGKSFVLSLVKGEVKRNVLIPNLIAAFSDKLGKGAFQCQRVSAVSGRTKQHNAKANLFVRAAHGRRELKYVQEAFDSNWLSTAGPNLTALEAEMSQADRLPSVAWPAAPPLCISR
jgi:hypothetical protein